MLAGFSHSADGGETTVDEAASRLIAEKVTGVLFKLLVEGDVSSSAAPRPFLFALDSTAPLKLPSTSEDVFLVLAFLWRRPTLGPLFNFFGMMMARRRDDVHATMAMMPMENGAALFSIEFRIYFI
jgi:hypothetical protein